MKRYYGKFLIAALTLIAISLLAQSPAPTPPYADQAELSKVEEWVLPQGAVESIAAEIAATLGLGSDRLPVRLKSIRTSDGVSRAFAVSTNPRQEGIVVSALKTIQDKVKIYSVGIAWFTDRSGTLHRTIEIDASGARVVSDSSHAHHYLITLSWHICNSCGKERKNQVIRVQNRNDNAKPNPNETNEDK